MTGFNDHKYMLFLDRKLYLATVNLQAERGLGKSFSAMLPFVEGLHTMGYLSDADYEVYRNKYSVGLEDAANAPTKADIIRRERKANKYKQLNRHFGEVLAQWSQLKDSAKQYHLKEAEKHKNLKNAKLVVDLANGQAVSLKAVGPGAI
jgi:hypothetical protein